MKNKLASVWGGGKICHDDGKNNRPVSGNDIFDEIDTIGKKYLYILNGKGEESDSKSGGRIERCNNNKCRKTQDLKMCQCKTVKYCNLDCLKEDWKNHKKKCQY